MIQKQHQLRKLRREGTGIWLPDCAEFIEWQDNAGALWIQGPSGSGKSVLSSTVITKLTADQRLFQEHGNSSAIAFFYFDFKQQDAQAVESALRRIILQLSAQSPDGYRALNKHYTLSKGQTPPTYQDLQQVLRELLSGLKRTYIILDALDECEDGEITQLLHLVSELRGWTKTPLHLFLTSQPRAFFSDFWDMNHHIYLRASITEHDIRLFVRSELRDNRKLKTWAARADAVIDRVVLKSNGMFRLAACLLLELSRCKRQNELDKTLADLPNDLVGIYDRLLQAIRPEDFVYVAAVFRWLVFSNGSFILPPFFPGWLTLPMLADAVAFDFSDPAHLRYDPSLRNDNANAIPEWLDGLTVIVGGSGGEQSLALAHASVRDYIISPQFYQKFDFDLSSGPSHTCMAQSCIAYLLHFSDHPLNSSTFPNYPWAFYAAQNWHYHMLRCHDPTIIFADLLRLLESGSRQCVALNNLRIHNRWNHYALKCFSRAPPPLYMYSEEGYTEIVRLLLAHGAQINLQAGKYGTALQAACAKGHMDVIRLLLENGADVHTPGGYYGNALQAVAHEGTTENIQILLTYGAEVNVQGGHYGNALQAASSQGSPNNVHLLLGRGAEVNAQGGEYENALRAACYHGRTEAARILLAKGADVNAQGGKYETALQAASSEGRPEDVQLLLEYGADVNAQGGHWGTALQAATYHGNTEVARVLLASGAEVNAQGGEYGTALQAAFCAKDNDLMRHANPGAHDLLRLLGVDSFTAASTYRPYAMDMARLLLTNGANVNVQGGKFGNALQAASSEGENEVVQLLLESGADVNAQGGEYGNALRAATRKGRTEIVTLLRDKGAVFGSAPPLDPEPRMIINAQFLIQLGT
ncbi:ankyrin repeat-containing domain protein [Mycena olivaceomarginata]|nr:ankyrin repeat-containing domain protein [Mycena olivaceomarginata]